jgi:hypothetical protein
MSEYIPAKGAMQMLDIAKRFRIALLLAVPAAYLPAQEQTFSIGGPEHTLDRPEQFMDVNAASMTADKAADLIDHTLGQATRRAPNFYCIIHLLRWNDAGKVDKQNWFVYSESENAWSDTQFQGLRIFGSHRIAVLYVHLNTRGASFDSIAAYRAPGKVLKDLYDRLGVTALPMKIRLLRRVLAAELDGSLKLGDIDLKNSLTGPEDAKVATALKTRDWDLQDLSTLESAYPRAVQTITANAKHNFLSDLRSVDSGGLCSAKDGGQDLVRIGHTDICFSQSYYATTYKVEGTKKLPSAISDLFALAALNANPKGDELKIEPVAVWEGRTLHIGPVPSDVKVTPSVTMDAKTTALESRTYDNEGRYYWDISAGLPLRSIKDTAYDATAGTFTAKKIEKQNLYAMINVFPFKMDTKGVNYRWLTPTLLAGVGITGKPLDRLVVGGGLGLNKVQFFAGCAITKKQFPGPASNPTLTTEAYRTNLIFGLNIPIRQVVKTLKAAK